MTLPCNKFRTPEQIKADEIQKLQDRLDEITDILLEEPFESEKWNKLISEQNTLSVKIATLNGEKMRQTITLN